MSVAVNQEPHDEGTSGWLYWRIPTPLLQPTCSHCLTLLALAVLTANTFAHTLYTISCGLPVLEWVLNMMNPETNMKIAILHSRRVVMHHNLHNLTLH